MLKDLFNTDPEVAPKRQALEKRKALWKRVQFVVGAFFVTMVILLYTNASDDPWAGVSHRDARGNLVVEPDWPAALAISAIVSSAMAGIAFWVCLRASRHEKT
jgi:zona occludens toxin (predicted ATPase)